MARGDVTSQGLTNIAIMRVRAGITQMQLATACGLSLSAIQRLEAGKVFNPGIRNLRNISLVLGCELDDICEDGWRWWSQFPGAPDEPPARGSVGYPDRADPDWAP